MLMKKETRITKLKSNSLSSQRTITLRSLYAVTEKLSRLIRLHIIFSNAVFLGQDLIPLIRSLISSIIGIRKLRKMKKRRMTSKSIMKNSMERKSSIISGFLIGTKMFLDIVLTENSDGNKVSLPERGAYLV